MVQAQNDQAKLELAREKMVLEDDRERDKIARDTVLKEHELELKYNAEIEDTHLRAAVARDRVAMDADLKIKQAMEVATQQRQAAAAAAASPAPGGNQQ